LTDYQQWLWEKTGERTVENLRNHGFDAHLVETGAQAREFIMGMIGGYRSFGFGGSHTIRALGLLEALREQGKTIYDHWEPGLSKEAVTEIRLNQGRCDCFFCSANAVSASGEVVNVDGVGNRTSAMTFGPRKVIIAAGMNKVTPDLESALRRIRDIAGPMRAKSLNRQTPCAETGFCSDCNSEQRICRITTILNRRPSLTDTSVILIREPMGY